MAWRYGEWGKLHEDDENPEDFMKDVYFPGTKVKIGCRFDDGSYTKEMRKTDREAMLFALFLSSPFILLLIWSFLV